MQKKLNRLRHRREFKFIFKRGRAVSSKYLTIRHHPNKLSVSRTAVVISTKISKSAVRRNRLRRRLQGVMTAQAQHLKSGNDLIFIVKTDFYSLDRGELEKQVASCLKQANLLNV